MRFAIALFFFFNDTATTEIYTLSLHDALPIFASASRRVASSNSVPILWWPFSASARRERAASLACTRSEEHTSELQSQSNLVCRLLLEKKKQMDTVSHLRTRAWHFSSLTISVL